MRLPVELAGESFGDRSIAFASSPANTTLRILNLDLIKLMIKTF
jgi:hypothetical protein